jgi:hypothetical protein
MTFIRASSLFRATAVRPAFGTAQRATISVAPRRFATQDYGSGKGNPAAEHPEKIGKNPEEELEHPGPAPPKVAQGRSPSSNSEQTGQQSSSSQTQKSSGSNTGSNSSNEGSKGVKGAQPKILNENPPSEENDEGVRQHNKEMSQRAEKAFEQVSNKQAEKEKAPGYFRGEY